MGTREQLSPHVLQTLELRDQGLSHQEIADKLGLKVSGIGSRLRAAREAGHPSVMDGKHAASEPRRNQALVMHRAGSTTAEIAAELGITQAVVGRYLARFRKQGKL